MCKKSAGLLHRTAQPPTLAAFRPWEGSAGAGRVRPAGQAILAAKAGATYLSPFIGRIDDSNWDGVELIAQISQIYSIQGFKTKILAASIRNALHIVRCAEAGADVCTCPLDSILGLLKHPLTDIGLAKFLEDAKKTI